MKKNKIISFVTEKVFQNAYFASFDVYFTLNFPICRLSNVFQKFMNIQNFSNPNMGRSVERKTWASNASGKFLFLLSKAQNLLPGTGKVARKIKKGPGAADFVRPDLPVIFKIIPGIRNRVLINQILEKGF